MINTMIAQRCGQPCWAWALEGRTAHSSSSSSSSSSSNHHSSNIHNARHARQTCSTIVTNSNVPRRVHVHATWLEGSEVGCSQQHGLQALTPQHQAAHQSNAPLARAEGCSGIQLPSRSQQQQQQLPNQALFQQIKSCTYWTDCLALLSSHGSSIDAMLLSTLCTHTVYLFELEQYHTVDHSAAPTAAGSPEQQTAHSTTSTSSGCSAAASSRRQGPRSTRNSNVNWPGGLGDKASYQLYMQHLSGLTLSLVTSGGFRGQQYSNVLWCFARCGYRLPATWTEQYLLQAQQHLTRFRQGDLARLIWATAALQARPPSSFVAAFMAASGFSMKWFSAQDLANTLWGLAALGVQPPTAWLHAALAAAARCWAQFKPFELSISVWGFAKLGVGFNSPGFWSMQQQRQQQQQQQQAHTMSLAGSPPPPPPAATAAAGTAAASGSLQAVGFGWLLGSIALLSPSMGLQEIANLLWGLAVGRATLTQPQTQALGDQACIILAQSLSHERPFIASFTVCLWALARLGWVPTLPQAQIVVRLTTQALWSQALDLKHASILVFSLGRLQLRPPQPVMQSLMDRLASGLHVAGMPEVLQVLAGCRRLGWRISKSWWLQLHDQGITALPEGNAAELVHLLANVAAFRPLRPHAAWWEVYWDSLGVELEAAVAGLGLAHIAHTRNLPKGSITVAAAPIKAALQREQRQLRRERRQQQLAALRSGRWVPLQQRQRHNVRGSRKRQWQPHRLAWLLMAEALQVVTKLQGVMQEHQQPHLLGGAQVTPARAAVLLWAAARLKRPPPRVLMWQLLLVVLAGVHSLSSQHLTVALWAVGHLLHHFGRGRVECFKLIQPLALVGQWRLMVGLAGSSKLERGRLAAALRYLAAEDGRLGCAMLLHSSCRQQSWGQSRQLHVVLV